MRYDSAEDKDNGHRGGSDGCNLDYITVSAAGYRNRLLSVS